MLCWCMRWRSPCEFERKLRDEVDESMLRRSYTSSSSSSDHLHLLALHVASNEGGMTELMGSRKSVWGGGWKKEASRGGTAQST